MSERRGNCLCGAVRYRLTAEPLVTRICWCRDCQRISANGTVNAIVPTAASPSPSLPANEVHLVFVDVASGDVRSQPAVSPAPRFVDQLLTYFDQYALSHEIWAPDSTSVLLPEIEPDGTRQV